MDAYQGLYKIRFYFWIGLQLLFRTIIFGLSVLDRSTNLTISATLIGSLLCITGRLSPFKSQINNILEVLCMLNLLAIFTISLHTTANKLTIDIIINILVSLALFKLVCIIVLHVKSLWDDNAKCCGCNGMIKKLSSCFWELISKNTPPKPIELVNAVLEVAYDYKEYQELLIGY